MTDSTLPSASDRVFTAPRRAFLSSKQIRKLRESLLAYIFLFPALLVIGLFGLFPLVFAVFQSTLRGLNTFTGRYDGLANYVRAIDDLAYVLTFWLGLFLLALGLRFLFKVIQQARQNQESAWPMLLPGLMLTGSLALAGRFIFLTLGELLLIPEKLQGVRTSNDTFTKLLLETLGAPGIKAALNWALLLLIVGLIALYTVNQRRSHLSTWRIFIIPGLAVTAGVFFFVRLLVLLGPELARIRQTLAEQAAAQGDALSRTEQFRQMVRETFALPAIRTTYLTAIGLLVLSVAIVILVNRLARRSTHYLDYYTGLTGAFTLLVGGLGLGWLTWGQIQAAYVAALESGTSLNITGELVTISAGFVLLLLSWWLWRSANQRQSTVGVFFRLSAAAVLMIGAWVLIGELPRLVAAGDAKWWDGLRATVFYSVGTIPVQLVLSLVIATLLFQDLKGKTLLRIIYFLPYITPVVAAAGVFRVFFSNRPSAPMNALLASIGLPALRWLAEPTGVVQMLVGDGSKLEGWLAGPSLALAVVMLFGVWKFVGFNIVVFLAGLGNISRELYEAASIDGAGRWAQFRNITLPLLSPTIYFLTLWATIGTFKSFNSIWVLRLQAALGTVDTASIVIFNAMKRDTRYGYAAALAVMLLLIILLLTYINNRVAEKRVFYG